MDRFEINHDIYEINATYTYKASDNTASLPVKFCSLQILILIRVLYFCDFLGKRKLKFEIVFLINIPALDFL